MLREVSITPPVSVTRAPRNPINALDGLPDQSEGLGVDGGLDMVGPGLHEVEDGLDG